MVVRSQIQATVILCFLNCFVVAEARVFICCCYCFGLKPDSRSCLGLLDQQFVIQKLILLSALIYANYDVSFNHCKM